MMHIGTVRDRAEYDAYKEASAAKNRWLVERLLASEHRKEKRWVYPGYCEVCGRESRFQMDWEHANGDMPNYREKLLCEHCGLNNRQRFMAHYLKERLLKPGTDVRIYIYEQTTRFFDHIRRQYGDDSVIGSEYLGHDRRPGEIVRGLRHEDAMQLSLGSGSIDVVLSNDVYEHVPDVGRSLAEACRILRQGGKLFFSIPFHSKNDRTSMRARMVDGRLETLQPEQYHGNPVSAKGSLVFHDIGWDILDQCRQAGFRDAYAIVYYSHLNGHLGGGLQIVFLAER